MDTSHPPDGHDHGHGVAAESSDLPVTGIIRFAVWLTASMALTFLVVGWLFGWMVREKASEQPQLSPLVQSVQALPTALPPEPRLEGITGIVAPVPGVPTKFHWVDKKAGVVAVPVELGMKWVVDADQKSRQSKTSKTEKKP